VCKEIVLELVDLGDLHVYYIIPLGAWMYSFLYVVSPMKMEIIID